MAFLVPFVAALRPGEPQALLKAGGLPSGIATAGSRRSVLSVGAAAAVGALWKGDHASAAATDGIIGEPVVSGGPLPLTVGLGTGPPYVQKDVELAIDAGYRLFDTAQECTPLPSSHTALAACHA